VANGSKCWDANIRQIHLPDIMGPATTYWTERRAVVYRSHILGNVPDMYKFLVGKPEGKRP
jgi:hypothetical protein